MRPLRSLLPLALLLISAVGNADEPPTIGRFRLTHFGFGGPTVVNGLPAEGSLETLVRIGAPGANGVYFGGARLRFGDHGKSIALTIGRDEAEQWPVTLTYYELGQEPSKLELHLAGITPDSPRSLTVSWGRDQRMRIRFGDHQEVEFGPSGFVPAALNLDTSAGAMQLDGLRIVAREPPKVTP